ncbi:MAG: hypothetical protein A3F13_01435 [Gammaproteobacteria bacterium RIFCSPHIGHO2_12_FULL_40_19]|nr:MAG: hypothetical protein A3F13_01435 [Gammaproteobacteria bacterium RIFCSPHIGHO2_12_FULL_40_19]
MDFSLTEILVIVLVAFIVFGPEKLPDVARKVGKIIRKAKSIWQSVSKEIESTLSEAHSPANEQKPHEK